MVSNCDIVNKCTLNFPNCLLTPDNAILKTMLMKDKHVTARHC